MAKEEEFENESVSIGMHMNKSKEQLVQYVDYVKNRYEEVISQLQDSYGQQISELHEKLKSANDREEKKANESKENTTMLIRDIKSLKEEIDVKEVELSKTMGDLDWANGKVTRLEEALTTATGNNHPQF